jgi:hypothetical protein
MNAGSIPTSHAHIHHLVVLLWFDFIQQNINTACIPWYLGHFFLRTKLGAPLEESQS